MKKNNVTLRTIGFFIYLIGALAGMFLFAALTWANLESSFYFGYGTQQADRSLRLVCPRLLTPADNASYTAYIKNDAGQAAAPYVHMYVSDHLAARSDSTQLQMADGETGTVSGALSPEDVVFGHLVMVQVFQLRTAGLPSAESHCGILFVNFPWANGLTTLIGYLAICLLAIVCGYALWADNSRPLERQARKRMASLIILAVAVALGITIGLLGWWVPGLLLFAASVLLLVVMLANYAPAI
jgi:hypothetical protein